MLVKMMFVYFLAVILCSLGLEAALPPAQCLTGEFHKAKPGPETGAYKACHLYKNKTCCTAEFTEQLSVSPIRKIGNFSWNNCGDLGTACEAYMKEFECFYQCSPNVGYWKGKWKGSLSQVPLCSQFCDSWYEACKTENTCATNWLTDFTKNSYGNNSCNRTCKSFATVYGSGKSLCETMWGGSFVYTVPKTNDDCMHLNSSNADVVKMNTRVAEKFKSTHSHGTCIGCEGFLVSALVLAITMSFMA